HFARVHQQRDMPEEIETARVPASGAAGGKGFSPKGSAWPVWLVLKEAGLVLSTSEARRMIQQGAVEGDRRRVASTDETLAPGGAYLKLVGIRRLKHV